MFFFLLGLPYLAGADTGAPPFISQAADNPIGFNIQENFGSVADDKYWKDYFKTNELTGQIKAMVKDNDGNIYIGGTFNTVGGITVNRIARWDGTQWSPLGTGFSGTWDSISALAFDEAGKKHLCRRPVRFGRGKEFCFYRPMEQRIVIPPAYIKMKG